MKIAIANDHTAVDMKNELVDYISKKYGFDIINLGTDTKESCDYPVYGEKCARAVAEKNADMGIVICGTGIGISLAANKVKGIRCCVCSEPYSAKMSRAHNNANMLAFGARVIGIETAKEIVDAWLTTEFEGGRHQRRVDMINCIDDNRKLD